MSYAEERRFAVSSYMLEKNNKWIQKQKFSRRCHLLRKPTSVWVTCGRTEEW